MNSPLVSVLMPAYNAEKYIGEAIESILNQSYKNLELIIIDDCSIDNTWNVIQEYSKKDKRIQLVKNRNNLKLSKTLNKGINLARGIFIARMDADDVSLPKRLELQVNYLLKNTEVGIVGGVMEITDINGCITGKREYPKNDKLIRRNMFFYSPFSHPLIMIRASVLKLSGLYDPSYNPAEDYELYFRIGLYTKFANLPSTLLRYRIVPKSMTTGGTKEMEEKTIEIRNKYGNTPKYKMTKLMKMYNWFHQLSLYLIHPKIKIALFNLIRNSKSL